MAVLLEDVMPSACDERAECPTCSRLLLEPFVRCCVCEPKFDLCLQCFAKGVELGHHSNDHSYEIVSNQFPLLEETWNANEEVQMLDALQDCGLGNWTEVAKNVHSKSSEECEKHYMKYFVEELNCPELCIPELQPRSDLCTTSMSTCTGIPFKVSEDPPRPAVDSVRGLELAGYSPCRADFDVEYDNYAEFDVKEIAFDPADSDLLREFKLAAVDIYRTRLKNRWYRKWIVKRYGLINIKRWQILERRLSKQERDLRDRLRPLARLHSPEEHEKFLQGLLLESFLKKQIVALQEYRAAGIRTGKDAEIYERLKKHREEERVRRKVLDDILLNIQDQKTCQAWLQRQAFLDSGKSVAPIPLPSLGRKPAARLDISGTPGVELLTGDEREICSSLRLLPHDYMNYKASLIKECEKCGSLRLAQARLLIKIDVNKTRKLYNFFLDKNLISKPQD